MVALNEKGKSRFLGCLSMGIIQAEPFFGNRIIHLNEPQLKDY